jgi:uncharacterized HAD superfamily protein
VANYLVDIDGCVTEDVPNEEVERMPHVVPFDGAVDYVNNLYDSGHIVTFFTSRTEDMRAITKTWLDQWGFKHHSLLMGKPRGGNYIWIDNHDVTGVKYPVDVNWSKK